MKEWEHQANGFREYVKRIVASPSRSFFVVCLSFIGGVVLAAFLNRPIFEIPFWIFANLFLFAALIFPSRTGKMILWILFAFLIGWLRFGQTFPPSGIPNLLELSGRQTVIKGKIQGEVVVRTNNQEVTLVNIQTPDEPLFGKLLVRIPRYPTVWTGDTLAFRCRIQVPESKPGFRYDRFLNSRGILATCSYPQELDIRPAKNFSFSRFLLQGKQTMLDTLALVLPEPHAGFVSGLLFGGSQTLSEDLRGDFSRVGVSHVTAASGYNVAIFSQLLLLWLMRSSLGRKRALPVAAGFVVIYVFLAGATAAVVRAGIMALLAMLGTGWGRTPSMRNILALTAVVMLLLNPRLLFDDVGFQLSFAATIGLVLLASRFESLFRFVPETFGVRTSLAATFAATTLSTPVLLWNFGTFSFIAPIVNLLILPWIPYLMLFGSFAIGVGFLSSSLGSIVALPAIGLSSIVLHVVHWFGLLPFASSQIPFAQVFAITSAGGITFFLVWLSHRPRAQDIDV
ncbi:MAG: ComEC/Rec2-related protein [Candidatus Uhrbacteria bacterium GW2011_GWF2_41_16]|uniref:ComEC/Rec2-related protein n=2 Tax=Candidatus Uhriibacteriota TaxID=1752732 RepID=A0A0G0VBZ8_9BACT|nr:MAG: ComEC/Rec2-related protein [Candidatus Uhrbacteria bacterium GW2011_GWA2_41_10]KKR87289.1 MAG: ComEC/Rec2-related protein [Candidatus Uhrbacteria bacterium GW2011_GWC2_41_11]KKR98473.1 MAG: ComEC/Rec2-related protein [Candidatus Uhrbacteria bacterium GW2011_GWF2_41_16]